MALGRKPSQSSLGKSSSGSRNSQTRRGATKWSASMRNGADQLRSVSEPRNLKSCMKVSTLEDSIRSCKPKRMLPVQVKGISYKDPNSLSKGASRRGHIRTGTSLRNLPFPHWLSIRKNGEEKASKPQNPAQCDFRTLQFREYNILAGDNPGVSKDGPALELGWEYKDEEPVCVEEFESWRTLYRPRRTLKEIKLSKAERERRLRESGVTEKELKRSAQKVRKAKMKREETIEIANCRKATKNEEQRENMKYNFRRMFRLEKTESKREDELWDKANRGILITCNTDET